MNNEKHNRRGPYNSILSMILHTMVWTSMTRNVCAFSLSSQRLTSAFLASRTTISMPRTSPRLQTCRMMSTSSEDQGLVHNMLYRIRQCNEIPKGKIFYDFVVDEECVGKVTPEMSEELISAVDPPIFQIQQSSQNQNVLTFTQDAGSTSEARTAAVMSVMKQLHENNVIEGWRDELYPVSSSFDNTQHKQPLFLMERAATPTLGIIQYGVHINGLVQTESNSSSMEPKMWIARRSPTKSKYPGMLDHIVAGGQPAGISLMENVIKECGEEAGVPPHLAQMARPVGAISYETYNKITRKSMENGEEEDLGGIERSILFCYDLYLPPDFVPKVVDGEVEEFFLWDIEQVRESMDINYPDPIKPNCYPVIIDFLMRMGYLEDEGPDTKGYLDVLKELRSGQCV